MSQRKWKKFSPYLNNADCQLHTIYTDGQSSPEDYFEKAEENGLDFILFSEHVRRKTDYDYLKFKEHVYRAGAKSRVKFAVGAEAKVLDLDGNIDISDELAKEAEMILFSFHTPHCKDVEEYKRAIVSAAKNPLSDVFAHPTFYHNWQGLSMTENDWIEILDGLYAAGVCYEFNKKYDLPGEEERRALKKSRINAIFGSDSHVKDTLLTRQEIDSFKARYC